VLRLFLLSSFKVVVFGVAAGLALSLALNQLMAKLLFNVKTTDAFTFAFAAGLLCFAALMASYLPARRATRVDPIIALRHE
jgi:ABC-type antimicrobial peptide transport system permease subunit